MRVGSARGLLIGPSIEGKLGVTLSAQVTQETDEASKNACTHSHV